MFKNEQSLGNFSSVEPTLMVSGLSLPLESADSNLSASKSQPCHSSHLGLVLAISLH